MKNSVRPGFSTMTTWPRIEVSAGSGTRSCAPLPVQFTITGAPDSAAAWPRVRTGPTWTRPPDRREPGQQVVQVGRHADDRRGVPPARCEARRQAARRRRPDLAERGKWPGPVRAAGRGAGRLGPADQPDAPPALARRPVAGSTSRVSAHHRRTRSLSSTRCGPQIAPATAEVVCAGRWAVRMATARPSSARHTAVVSPMTPAPRTRTSVARSVTDPTVARPEPGLAAGSLNGWTIRRAPANVLASRAEQKTAGGRREVLRMQPRSEVRSRAAL